MKCTPFSQLDVKNKRIFVRADLNVPLEEEKIENPFRIQAILPTIDTILKKGGKVILATHMGRPSAPISGLSTATIASWLAANGYKVRFEANLGKAQKDSSKNFDEVMILENLRFFPGEGTDDQVFAQTLSNLADCYVNEAFGLIHRKNTSITLLPRLFSQKTRALGPLMEKEIAAFENLKKQPKETFSLILGGVKVSDKLPLIEHFLKKAKNILICPPLSFTFMHALGQSVGSSLIDKHSTKKALEILEKAKGKTNIFLPKDYVVAYKSMQGKLSTINYDEFGPDLVGITVGPKTIELFESALQKTKALFVNGLPGFLNRPETLIGTKKILGIIKKSNTYSMVGGGDSVAMVQQLDLEQNVNFLSTGGGSAIAFLSHLPLPGIAWCR
ncbi:phosphoglycerate kinase [bacterium]|jgi:phosphoglycerate kinase|nr:phosphoglycerate kinase [bacterium]